MGFEPTEPEQRRELRAALQAMDITVGELWLNYCSFGGAVGRIRSRSVPARPVVLPKMQRDLLAMAVNELIDAVPRLRAPYADDLTESSGSPRTTTPRKHPPGTQREPTTAARTSGPRGKTTIGWGHNR